MEEKILGSVQIPPAIINDIKSNVGSIADFALKIENEIGDDITNLFDFILAGSIKLKASDIHIEPEKDKSKLRVRIDGILHDVFLIDHKIYHNLLNRIKLLSKIKLNITDSPQDGRFTITAEDLTI